MGLFGKDKKVIDASNYMGEEDNRELAFASEEDVALENTPQQKPKSGGEYGIQDAIELMRELPDVNTEIVISVVIKTLGSANIQVAEIIADAQKRETRIENRSVELIKNIEQLEVQIAGLTEEITHLNSDFEETSKVKNLLEASLGQKKSKSKKTAKEAANVEAVSTAANDVVADNSTVDKTVVSKTAVTAEDKEAIKQDASEKKVKAADDLSLVEGSSFGASPAR